MTDSRGSTWRKRPGDQYIVEATDLPINPKGSITKNRRFFNLLPCSTCYTPKEVYWQLHANQQQAQGTGAFPGTLESAVRFTLENEEIKYAARHLWRLDKKMDLNEYSYESDQSVLQTLDMLESLLKHSGSEDPSWRSLLHFATFMTFQLKKCDASGLYQVRNLKNVGFKKFVVQFMALMAKEFSMPWIKIKEGTPSTNGSNVDDHSAMYQLIRAWNSSHHPYIFFNKEGEGSLSYYGCTFSPEGSLIDSVSGEILEPDMVSTDLMHGLKWNGINFAGDDDLNLKELCRVLGVRRTTDPDPTFKLTPNNIRRILAIHTRWRCGLPVVIMGDRGCGKTSLIRYMCRLQAEDPTVKNLIHIKVHGGTTANDIMMCLTRAEIAEKLNKASHNVDTILYLDEANTTEAIDLVKEIICDGRARGHHIDITKGSLKIIVSCNPYRRCGAALVERLKSAGLGFNKFVHQRRQHQGLLPFGEMVYNVRPLPPGMLDFVWDYGHPEQDTRRKYSLQMVIERVECGQLKVTPEEAAIVAYILSSSQSFLSTKQQDECGLVSLKDVSRCLDALMWFLDKMPAIEAAVQRLKLPGQNSTSTDQSLNSLTRSLVLALAVCYYARLRESRKSYLEEIAAYFKGPCSFKGGAQRLEREISNCQDAFLNELKPPAGIARNSALTENVFMMVVCIELSIPLFVIGKPGTSKSLAKILVANAMEGPTSESELFKTFKRVQFTTHQCNPNTNRKDINSTFEEASMVADGHKTEPFVSIVCLDELGLAEGSFDTPLKILQPYLENVTEEEEVELYPPKTTSKNISFIGMSNWAVDVANMNTGIVLLLDDPNQDSLVETAKGICSSDDIFMKLGEHSSLLPALADAFLTIFTKQQNGYFGYPDFYNLIKIIVAFCRKSGRGPTSMEVEHSVRRNFDHCGSSQQWKVFTEEMQRHEVLLRSDSMSTSSSGSEDPYSTEVGLLRANLEMSPNLNGDTRHMLVETDNYAAVSILMDQLLKDKSPILFFGSSFRLDQTYIQMCRSVNHVRRCMENGRTVVLVNHSNLYECVHDVLNLHFVSFAGQNYVELALGTNRVKCRIHKDFRLIVVENREIVNNCFSAPLLGRFEKHFLAASSLLTDEQKFIADRLIAWVANFAASICGKKSSSVDIKEAIVGYHKDVIPALVYRECQRTPPEGYENIIEVIFKTVQNSLIECATARAKTAFKGSTPQGSTSLENFLWKRLQCSGESDGQGDIAQITTHSEPLVDSNLSKLEEGLRIDKGCIQLKDLLHYDTEQQFRREIRRFYAQSKPARDIYLILQCKDGHKRRELIACATHYIQDERSISRLKETRAHVIFVIEIPQSSGSFRGFPGGDWISAHIPNLMISDGKPKCTIKREASVGTKPKPMVKPKTKKKESDYATIFPKS